MNEAGKRLRGSLFLFAAAMIWGCAFTAQSVAADSVGPWTFNGIRFLLGGAEVLLLSKPLGRIVPAKTGTDQKKLRNAGIVCGFILIGASVLQQAGIRWTTAGKAGFITSLYVVFVPVIGALFLHQKHGLHVWLSALIAAAGLFLLSGADAGGIETGDALELLCAAAFAVHILVVDRAAGEVDPIRFSAIQFLTAGFLGILGAFLFETVRIEDILQAAGPILYAGLLSVGFGYTLQILGQQDADPAAASVILSLESVFSALFGFLLLHEVMNGKELAGCALVFAAVLLSQRKETEKPAPE